MHQFDGAVGGIGDARPCLRHRVDGVVVVLGHAVATDERVNDQNVEFALVELGNECIHDRMADHKSIAHRLGNHE
jgi:hypothetical protein